MNKKKFLLLLMSALIFFTSFSNMFVVSEAAEKIRLNETNVVLTSKQGILLELKGFKGKTVWSSSNKKIATVNKHGLVLAKRSGCTVICVKAGKKRYKCKVMVKNVKVKSLKLNRKKMELDKGDKFLLKATIAPSNASNRKVIWKSSNKKIASVNSVGQVTAKRAGAVTITATAKDGSKKKTVCRILIKSAKAKSGHLNYSMDICVQAPYADPSLWNAFEKLGFHLIFDSKLDCNGIFSPQKQAITLKYPGQTIYHELGHFLAFLAVNTDYTDEWNDIYKKEKRFVTCDNKEYVTKDPQEYFAESYEDYALNTSLLRKNRPMTFAYISKCIDEVRGDSDEYWQNMRDSYRKMLDWK